VKWNKKLFLHPSASLYWKNNLWDRKDFERSRLGKKFTNQRLLVSKFIKKYEPENILVLCCGTGNGTRDLEKFTFTKKIVAIDINKESCKKARSITARKKVTVVNDDIYNINYSAIFDAVVCLDALHHLPDQETILSKIYKSLKPGGVFIGNYFGKELFIPWMIKKHGVLKYHVINSVHHLSKLLLHYNLLPKALVKRGWMKTFLFDKRGVINQLSKAHFVIEYLVSDEWHFFVAKKSK